MNTVLTTLDGPRTAAFTQAGHWRNTTLYQETAAHAMAAPDRVAVRESDRTVTFAALIAAVDRLASAWDQAGLRPGDRVAVWLPSRIELAVTVLACSRAGYVVSPSLHRDHTVAEVAELVSRMRAAAVVTQPGYGADADRHDLAERLAGSEHVRHTVTLPPAAQVEDAFPALAPDSDVVAPPPVRTDPNTVVYLAYTSGTTGLPKGVMHSDNTLLAPVRAVRRDWSFDVESIVYSMSPLSHNLGFGAMLLALTTGAEFVVHDLPRGAGLAERLRQTRATFAFGVPTHAIDLLAELRTTGTDLPDLRGFRISGAPVPPTVAQGLLDNGVTPQSGYGMTEGGSHHYTLPTDPPELIVASSGRPCAGYEVRIVASEDPERELPAGEIGQIAARGAALMLGYFDDQLATESSVSRSGWFLTGDLGWQDDAGNLRITGRKKDVIIRGGHNIFPAKIENLAMRHPGVAKAAVVPVADERLGEKVCLIVQPQDGTTPDPDAVLAHLDEAGLSRYDMPEFFVLAGELPLMPSGKILKRRLLEWIDDGRIVPTPIRFPPPSRRADTEEAGTCAR